MGTIDYFMLDENDNIAIAVRSINSGETLIFGDSEITIRADIPVGYKFAVRAIPAGHSVVKKAVPIGVARVRIEPGSLVHVENMMSTYIAPHLR